MSTDALHAGAHRATRPSFPGEGPWRVVGRFVGTLRYVDRPGRWKREAPDVDAVVGQWVGHCSVELSWLWIERGSGERYTIWMRDA